MRISGINNVNSVYNSTRAKSAYGANRTENSSDSLAISDYAKELSIANKAVSNSSDVRTEKVTAIKEQIESGEYNVTAKDVADKILGKYFG